MRFDDVWITGTGGVHGELVPIRQAVADGRYAPSDAAEAGMTSVSASAQPPPEMAVRAARQALGAEKPGLHLHAAAGFQGLDLWSASCWIAHHLFGGPLPGLSLQLNALCNSGLAAVEVGATMLTARPDLGTVLVTASDWFPEPAIDRWNLDSGILLGDGAAATVLSRGAGRLRLLSCSSWSDPSLEGLQRGDREFAAASPAALEPLVLRQLAREFYAVSGRTPASVVQAHVRGLRQVVHTALDEAEVSLAQARWVVPPFVGRTAFRFGYAEPLGLDPSRTLLDLGLSLGHMGGVDHLYALDHLVRSNAIGTGETVVLIGVGGGFTFSCAVLRA